MQASCISIQMCYNLSRLPSAPLKICIVLFKTAQRFIYIRNWCYAQISKGWVEPKHSIYLAGMRWFRDDPPGFGKNCLIIWWWKTYGAKHMDIWQTSVEAPNAPHPGAELFQEPLTRVWEPFLMESVLMEVESMCLPVHMWVQVQLQSHLLGLPHPSDSHGSMFLTENMSGCKGLTWWWIRHIPHFR